MSGFRVVLVEPEIPPNTGNIARTCAATGTELHLVRPLGFDVDDKTLKRAGLDYWHFLDAARVPGDEKEDDYGLTRYGSLYENLDDFFARHPGGRYWYATTKGATRYTDVRFEPGDWLLFGAETRGLPKDLLAAHPERCIRVPMQDEARSLNLSNSVAVVLYEALRQTGFAGLR